VASRTHVEAICDPFVSHRRFRTQLAGDFDFRAVSLWMESKVGLPPTRWASASITSCSARAVSTSERSPCVLVPNRESGAGPAIDGLPEESGSVFDGKRFD